MEKLDGVPSLWHDEKERQQNPKWIKGEDGRQTLESPSLHRGIGRNADVYGTLFNWPRPSDKYLFLAGFGSQLAACTTSAIVVSRTIRERFFLGGNVSAFMSTYGAVSMAMALAILANDTITVQNLFHSDRDSSCFMCMQSRQALANVGAAVIFPAVLLIPDSMYHAARDPGYGTSVPLPKAGEFRRAAQFVFEKYKGAVLRRLGWAALANIMVAYAGTYLQMKAAVRISLLAEDDPTLVRIPDQKEGWFSRFTGWLQSR